MITYQYKKNKQATFQYGCVDLPLRGVPRAVELVKKIVLGPSGLEDFGFSIHVAHFRSAEIVI